MPKVYLGLIAAITLAGFLLRLPSFGDSLLGDEISTFYIVHGHSLARVLSLLHSRQETTPPLFFILAWVTRGWLGNEAESIRLVSLVTGIAAIPLTFLLGLWTVGRRAALVGATCVAFSPFMIFYSSEARTYMLVLFLGLLSSICLIRSLDTGRMSWWVGYAASTCAAIYSHYSVVFFLVVQLAWALWTVPRARKHLLIANAAAIIGFLPWINVFRADLHYPNLIPLLLPLNLHNILRTGESFWIGHPIVPLHEVPGDVAVFLALAGLGVALIGVAAAARKRKLVPWHISSRLAMIILLAVAPAVVMVLYSWARVDVLGGANIIASWPALGLAIGAFVTAPPRPWRIAAVSLTLTAYVIGGISMLSSTSQRSNVAAAVSFVDRTGRSGDPIVSSSFFFNPLSEVDAALAGTPSWTYLPGNTLDRARPVTASVPHPVIRLGEPPLNEQFHFLAEPNPNPVFFVLPEPTPQRVAQEAMALARHGTIFLLTPITIHLHARPRNAVDVAMRQFIRSMEPRFRLVQSVTYPSDITPENVYVFRETASGGQK